MLRAWIIYGVFVVFSLFAAVDFGYSLNQFRGEYLKNFLLFLLVVQFVTSENRAKGILEGIEPPLCEVRSNHLLANLAQV